jgi:hypothetical protein
MELNKHKCIPIARSALSMMPSVCIAFLEHPQARLRRRYTAVYQTIGQLQGEIIEDSRKIDGVAAVLRSFGLNPKMLQIPVTPVV